MRKKILVIAALMAAATPAIAKDCTATAARDVKTYYDETGKIAVPVKEVYYHGGQAFQISGGSSSPSIACQHGGDCVAIKDLIIPPSCKRVTYGAGSGASYSWEATKVEHASAEGSICLRTADGLHTPAYTPGYCTRNPTYRMAQIVTRAISRQVREPKNAGALGSASFARGRIRNMAPRIDITNHRYGREWKWSKSSKRKTP